MARKSRKSQKSCGGVRVSLRKSAPQPQETLFFISPPPRKLNARYVVLADGIITSDGVVMA